MKIFKTIIFIFFYYLGFSQGQNDHINWSFNKFTFAINDTWKMDITPIVRLNKNFTNLQNSSLDYMFRRSIAKDLSIGFLGRTWFVPNQKIRQFIWFDVNHQLPNFNLPIALKQRLRIHWALDINDRMDSDFIRYQISLNGKFENSMIQPYLALEPFYQLNKLNYFERLRTEIGFKVKASKDLTFIFLVHKQDRYDQEDLYTEYLWWTGLHYTFKGHLLKPKVID